MKIKLFILVILLGLFLIWGCGPVYPEDEGDVTYPAPEFSDAQLNYNNLRHELHCEIRLMYDEPIPEVNSELTLTGFEVSGLEFTLNDSALDGDAIAGDNIYSRNITLNRIDSIDGTITVQYEVLHTSDLRTMYFDTLYVNANMPPSITGITMPDTLLRPDSGTDYWHVYISVDDPDGVYDVTNAYCQSLSNSTGNWNDYPLYDSGENGDETAGDGIFSTGFQLPSNTPLATYYFRFRAKDSAANFSEWSLDSVVVR